MIRRPPGSKRTDTLLPDTTRFRSALSLTCSTGRRTSLGRMIMADDKRHVGAPDRDRISLGEDYEIRDWTEALGVSEAQLREAVDAVGNSADKVRDYLKLG